TRPEGDLLPRRPEPRGDRGRPLPGGIQGAEPRGALLLRDGRRVRDEQRPRVRREEDHRRRPRRREALGAAQGRGSPWGGRDQGARRVAQGLPWRAPGWSTPPPWR